MCQNVVDKFCDNCPLLIFLFEIKYNHFGREMPVFITNGILFRYMYFDLEHHCRDINGRNTYLIYEKNITLSLFCHFETQNIKIGIRLL